MSNPAQLLLLADHIKLSLLEWQRAKTLDVEPNSQEAEISRSLESLRLGIEAAERKDKERQDDEDIDEESRTEQTEQITDLRLQYQDLVSQFTGSSTSAQPDPSSSSTTISTAETLDGEQEQAKHVINSTTTIRQPKPQHPKSVRFTDASNESDFEYTDTTSSAADEASRAALFPYRDDPSSSSPSEYDHSNLSNPEILESQRLIVREQDDQLDRLGESIGRQHQLSIQIGDELEGQVQLLDDVDRHVDRGQQRMDSARQRLGRIRRGSSNDSKGMCVIVVLIVILVLLIIILK